MKSDLAVCSFMDHASGYVFKKSLPNAQPQYFLLYFPLEVLMVLSFTLRYTTHFKLIFVCDVIYEVNFFCRQIFSCSSIIC